MLLIALKANTNDGRAMAAAQMMLERLIIVQSFNSPNSWSIDKMNGIVQVQALHTLCVG